MIYFDNSATTALCREAKDAISAVLDRDFGNPSSLHRLGVEAQHVMNRARQQVWQSLELRGPVLPGSLLFTSGGSEANNLAILGSATAKTRRGTPKMILTAGEHSSVEACASHLESTGWRVVRIGTRGGVLDLEQLQSELTPDTVLVSLMLVNNETGAVYDTASAFDAARRLCPGALLHGDAVQAYGKLHLKSILPRLDFLSVSSHKIHGPKGVGALYVSPAVRKARNLSPLIFGGGQEDGMRSGTENTPGIAGFGAAAEVSAAALDENAAKMTRLREALIARLREDPAFHEVRLHLPPSAAPHILNLSVPGIRSETMLHFLESRGIYVSSGSACSSHSGGISRALTAFGLEKKEAECAVRISLCAENTEDELTAFFAALEEGLSSLARMR